MVYRFIKMSWVTFTHKPHYQNVFHGLFSVSWSCLLFQEKNTNYKIKYWEKLNCFALSDLCHQRSSVQGAKFIRNVVVPVGTRVQMAWTVMMQSMEPVWGLVFRVASVHQDWCKTIEANASPSICVPVRKVGRRTSLVLLFRTAVTPGM